MTSASRPHAPAAPPSRIVMTRGRRHEIDTSRHCCPDLDRAYSGWDGVISALMPMLPWLVEAAHQLRAFSDTFPM